MLRLDTTQSSAGGLELGTTFKQRSSDSLSQLPGFADFLKPQVQSDTAARNVQIATEAASTTFEGSANGGSLLLLDQASSGGPARDSLTDDVGQLQRSFQPTGSTPVSDLAPEQNAKPAAAPGPADYEGLIGASSQAAPPQIRHEDQSRQELELVSSVNQAVAKGSTGSVSRAAGQHPSHDQGHVSASQSVPGLPAVDGVQAHSTKLKGSDPLEPPAYRLAARTRALSVVGTFDTESLPGTRREPAVKRFKPTKSAAIADGAGEAQIARSSVEGAVAIPISGAAQAVVRPSVLQGAGFNVLIRGAGDGLQVAAWGQYLSPQDRSRLREAMLAIVSRSGHRISDLQITSQHSLGSQGPASRSPTA
jgi:hypothetical protein